MFFSKKKPHDRAHVADISDIKEAMEEEPSSHKIPSQVSAQEVRKMSPYEEPTTAPLFVKVDKYKHILRDVHEIQLYLSGVRQLMDLMHDVEAIRLEAMKILRATVQRMDKTVVEIDSDLLRPGASMLSEVKEDTEVRHIESSLGELQKQLSDLKKELHSFQ